MPPLWARQRFSVSAERVFHANNSWISCVNAALQERWLWLQQQRTRQRQQPAVRVRPPASLRAALPCSDCAEQASQFRKSMQKFLSWYMRDRSSRIAAIMTAASFPGFLVFSTRLILHLTGGRPPEFDQTFGNHTSFPKKLSCKAHARWCDKANEQSQQQLYCSTSWVRLSSAIFRRLPTSQFAP
eukprot:6201575-Pleurochrysis_carterae.AAC.2